MAKTPSRSALLARDLLGRIARRELRPGDPVDLPALGRRHGVSRTVVREALADLGGKGLVVARPKVGTTIAPESQWNLLDPVLVGVAIAEPGPDSMLAEAIELRRVVEPALAAAAARDAGRTQRAALLDAVRAIAGAVGDADRDRWAEADAAFHAAIAEACGNRLLRSIDHALVPVRALHRQRLMAAQMTADGAGPEVRRTLALQTALGLAIVRRDPTLAAEYAHALADAAHASLAATGVAPADTAPPVAAAASGAPAWAANGAGTPSTAPGGASSPRPGADPRVVTVDGLDTRSTADATALMHRPVAPSDEWADTRTMVRHADALAPIRRARLDLDDAPAPVVVPALLADVPVDATAYANAR